VLCFDLNGTGVVNHVWFTMGGGMATHTILSFYVDDEVEPSIAFAPTVGLASDASEDTVTPWGNEVSLCQPTALQRIFSLPLVVSRIEHGRARTLSVCEQTL
jgi:hypothetical protein